MSARNAKRKARRSISQMYTRQKTILLTEWVNAAFIKNFQGAEVNGILTLQYIKTAHQYFIDRLGEEGTRLVAKNLLDNYYEHYEKLSENGLINFMVVETIMVQFLADLKANDRKVALSGQT